MLNAIGNLFAAPGPRTSRQRVLGLLNAQHLETRLALTAPLLAPAAAAPVFGPVQTPVQAPVVAEQSVAGASEEHSYPVTEEAVEYSDSEPLLMGAPAAMVLGMADSGEASEVPAQEIQFPDTNQIPDNTVFFESVQSLPQAAVAVGQESVQSPLPFGSVNRAGLESSPSITPIGSIAEEEQAPGENGHNGESESDNIDGEESPAEGESAAVMGEQPVLVDETAAQLDMDTAKEDAESSESEPMAKSAPAVTSDSDISQAEDADDDVQQTSAALDAVTIEVSDLDEFFSREQSTVAPPKRAVATVAIGLLGAAQMRRSRRESEVVGDQGL